MIRRSMSNPDLTRERKMIWRLIAEPRVFQCRQVAALDPDQQLTADRLTHESLNQRANRHRPIGSW
jgi:hypothetical protein